jgi:hypothetical protein
MNKLVDRLLYTEEGNMIVSAVLGLGLAVLFVPVCKNTECIDFIAPNMYEEHNKTYRIADDCFHNKVVPVKCK